MAAATGRIYKTKYKPEFCELLVEHQKKGLSFESFGGITKASRETMYAWLKKYPAFAEAKAVAETACMLWWENLGMAAVRGADVTDPNGKVLLAGKKVSIVLWIYNMKCRFRDQWAEDLPPMSDTGRKVFVLAYGRKPKSLKGTEDGTAPPPP